MLQFETAKALYDEIKAKALDLSNDEDFRNLYSKFLKNAVDYANTRARWAYMSQSERIDADKSRTIKHNALISSLMAICRILSIADAELLLPDRKTQGDFACYMALFMGLEQR